MATTSGPGRPNEASPLWPHSLATPAQDTDTWPAGQPASSIPLGGQLHGRPYVGPPTVPSRTIPPVVLRDPVAISYQYYSAAQQQAFAELQATRDNAWQDYTRIMQDANAAYEVAMRRASLQLDGRLAEIRRD